MDFLIELYDTLGCEGLTHIVVSSENAEFVLKPDRYRFVMGLKASLSLRL